MAVNLISTLGAAQNAIGAVGGAINTAGKLGDAISKGFEDGDVLSALRAIDLPSAGEAVGDLLSAVASFGGDANSNDWRVRLSLANWSSFRTSPVLAPLKDAGGLIFPYTPIINMSSKATYQAVTTTHSNYTFRAYQNSDPGEISITAPMNVEDPTQGLYWIAAVHYLRSLTKMFTGNDPKAGNPPPIIFLNGYGNYVFKNVPCVVTSFSTTLNKDCDYIGVNVVGSAAGEVEGIAEGIGGLAGAVGGALGGSIPGLSGITNAVSNIAGGIGQVAGLLGTFGIGGTASGGVSHVPTKSEFVIKLQPIYSRNSVRNFSLDRFVAGGYLNNSFGWV
jgi:hypothetical protein